MAERVTIKIPRALYERIQTLVEPSGFSSPTELIVFVLRDLIAEHGHSDVDRLSSEEVRAVRRRLHNLGYLRGGNRERAAEEV